MAVKLELVDSPSEPPFVRAEIDGDVKVFYSTKLIVEADNGQVTVKERK